MTRAAIAPEVDVLIQASTWFAHPDAESTVRRAIAAACSQVSTGGEVSVLLTDDAAVQELNRTWRHIDQPTNVLSFPAGQLRADGAAAMLGDIAIAYETTAREALTEHKPFLHHLAHLTVHGFLHLLGYDHEDHEQAEQMEQLEREILATLGVQDPYIAAEIGT